MDVNIIIEKVEEKLKGREVKKVYDRGEFFIVKVKGILDPWYKVSKDGNKILPLNLNTDMELLRNIPRKKLGGNNDLHSKR